MPSPVGGHEKNAQALKTRTEKELKVLELRLQSSPTLTLLKKISSLRATLGDLAIGQVEKTLDCDSCSMTKVIRLTPS